MVRAWPSLDYVRKGEIVQQNQSLDCCGLGASLHTGGFIPRTEHSRRLKFVLGREPTMANLHTCTHQCQTDHEWVSDRSRHVDVDVERLWGEAQFSQGNATTSQPSEFQIWKEAITGKKKGQIYGLGA